MAATWIWPDNDMMAVNTILGLGPFDANEVALVSVLLHTGLHAGLPPSVFVAQIHQLRAPLRAMVYFELARVASPGQARQRLFRCALQALGFRVIYRI
jgi:hypothetical protein